MKVMTLYICDKCKREYNEKEKAMKCEETHIMPVEFAGCEYTPQHTAYPHIVNITFSNGVTMVYILKQ